MLSDGTLRGIKPQATTYKIADRDGMYVTVSPRGTITFRLDYRLNGRRETLTIGRFGAKDGISLLLARERCAEARKAIMDGNMEWREILDDEQKKRHDQDLRGLETYFKNMEERMDRWSKGDVEERDMMPTALPTRIASARNPGRTPSPKMPGKYTSAVFPGGTT